MKAAKEKGKIEAGINLPPLPSDCRKTEPHAEFAIGEELAVATKREMMALDRQNNRTIRCAGFYDSVKKEFK